METEIRREVPELAAGSSKRDVEEELDHGSSKRQKTRGLTCLFAKAIIDESNLWHRRLDEKATQSLLMKGIKREYSIARTPQQNEVAERKNRTLIEAARTMLADSLLPTTFWAEVVNTACYVQNIVLVTKPHNKTPYELLHGRPSNISFMIPFGCPVTILNTLDTLGKFDGKADEGFLVGYSINSIKDNVDTVPTQQYILLPFLPDSPQSLKDAVADDAGKKNTEEPANEGERNYQDKEGEASIKEGDQDVQELRAELDKLLIQ
ncbi:ribonuclease H-like domain-containing protein [Tanacetum coccineum]